MATGFLSLLFAIIYYFGPDVKVSQWRWLTPGSAIGIVGWLLASLGLRIYVHYFNNYSATYGSLGTVIILLTWFYLSGLMLLVGGEINSEIEAAVQEKKLAAAEAFRPEIVHPFRFLSILACITLRIKRFPSFLHLTGRWRGMSCSWDISE